MDWVWGMKAREKSEGRSHLWGLSGEENAVPLTGRGEMGREAAGNKQFPLNVWILRGLLGTGRGAE